MRDRKAKFNSSSGIEIKPIYKPADVAETGRDLAEPGQFPFTRGVHQSMYRGRLWTMRQYAGFGTAEDTNQRFRFLLDSGQTGLSVAFDLPTQMGYDSNNPMAEGEVGRAGVAIDTVDDLAMVFDGIDLSQVSTSMTINATASILLAMYTVLADERGIGRDQLAGTVQNDLLKEFIARGTYIFPVEPSLRLVTDVFEFSARELPRWNSISISGYHMREAGCTAAQELAFTIADGLEYVGRAIGRGLDIEDFAPSLSFFFAAHNDLFEEVAKFRAARQLWASLLRERYKASDRACRLRFHTQTAGSALTAQQPLNNVVRVTMQGLAAVLGGTQSLHTNAYDEALALPTADSAKLALRTQQVIAHESGVADTVDPMAGSYYLETLTAELERMGRDYLAEIERRGGAAAAIDYMVQEIQHAAYTSQIEIERNDRIVVGVNEYRDEDRAPRIEQLAYPELEERQRRRLDEIRRGRSSADVRKSLKQISKAASGSDNLLPHIIEAVKVRATLGEISDALRKVWGEHRAAS